MLGKSQINPASGVDTNQEREAQRKEVPCPRSCLVRGGQRIWIQGFWGPWWQAFCWPQLPSLGGHSVILKGLSLISCEVCHSQWGGRASDREHRLSVLNHSPRSPNPNPSSQRSCSSISACFSYCQLILSFLSLPSFSEFLRVQSCPENSQSQT